MGYTTGLSGLLGIEKERPNVEARVQDNYVANPTEEDEFNAEFVKMVEQTATNGTHYTLPAAAGLNLMLTGQLSGCSFGVGSDALGARIVSHVRPDTSVDQKTFDAFVTKGLTVGVDKLFKSGDGYDSDTEKVAIVGHRTGPGSCWNIYAQKQKILNPWEYKISPLVKVV